MSVGTVGGWARAEALLLLALGALLAGPPRPVSAQTAAGAEIELLQMASERESAGELEAAERLLGEVLDRRTGSVPALLSLERVLRLQGRLHELPPRVEAALRKDAASALLNKLLIRTWSTLDRLDALETAAGHWFETTPDLETPYREVARVWAARGEYGRARAVLEEGRRRVGRPQALALELGDLYVTVGEPARAVREWALFMDRDGRGLSQIRRRLRDLPDGGAAVVPELVDLLSRGEERGRTEAALELAVESGLEERARTLTGRLLPGWSEGTRRQRLETLARNADAAGHAGLALWAYGRLLGLIPPESTDPRIPVLRRRHAELALTVGDTAAAAASYLALEELPGADAPRGGAADALRIELLAGQDPEAAGRALLELRAAEAGAARPAAAGDRLTAVVAGALLRAERVREAELLLAGVDGPRSALLRGRLALADGDMAGARAEYLSAATRLPGGEATPVLSLVTALSRISAPAGAVLAEALALRDGGRPGAAVDRLVAGVAGLAEEDRPPLLELAAGTAAAAGLREEARSLRHRIVMEHPRSPEAPPALLGLARERADDEGSRREARELLERLILEYPGSALVPEARRVLARLEREERE